MLKNKTVFMVTLLFFFILFIPQPVKAATRQTPTIFIHGLGGSHKSTDQLINAAKKDGAKKMMTINVRSDGSLSVSGHYSTRVKRPLIQVNFLNNEASIKTQSQWLTNVLRALQSQDHMTKYNVVAHSAGNVTLFETVTNNTHLPKLNKYVILAGPFNGVIGMNDAANQNQLLKHDKPKTFYSENNWYPSYQSLLDWSSKFPKQTKILNIYGDLNDGSHSDGQVTTQSALSINYLLRSHHPAIKNVKIIKASHSGLHQNNKRVNKLFIKFLWHTSN